MRTLSWRGRLVPALAALCIAAACSKSQPAPAPAPASDAPQYEPAATVKDLMQSIVDPSADVVWNAVTTVQTAKGTVDTVPKTAEDWLKVRHGAVGLSEAANLLMMPGRHVAQPHEKSDTPGVELEPAEMEVLINKDRAAFIQRAKALHEAGIAAVAAADAKDSQKLFEVGEQIEMACENCHSHYWYPNEKIPPVPASPR
jgi:hypothetical protein